MAVTQQDIAEKLGVSRRLVSYALNNKVNVGAEMRARILGIADELGYQTNHAAKSLVTGRTNQIALCLPTLSLPFHAQFIHHFEALARVTEYELLVTTTLNSASLAAADGVILHASEPIGNIPRPAVVIQSGAPYTVPTGNNAVDQVLLDITEASKAAMSHLIGLGKPRIACVIFATMVGSIDPRLLAYQAAMKQANLAEEIIIVDYFPSADLRSLTDSTLQKHFAAQGFPDALFCCNDEMAIGAYRALREMNRSISDETAVIGCDDIPEARDLFPPLSTIRYAWEDVCNFAWEMLLARVENPKAALHQLTFSSELVLRKSSG